MWHIHNSWLFVCSALNKSSTFSGLVQHMQEQHLSAGANKIVLTSPVDYLASQLRIFSRESSLCIYAKHTITIATDGSTWAGCSGTATPTQDSAAAQLKVKTAILRDFEKEKKTHQVVPFFLLQSTSRYLPILSLPVTWIPHLPSTLFVYLKHECSSWLRNMFVRSPDCPHQAALEIRCGLVAANWE